MSKPIPPLETMIKELTPWEKRGGIFFKREDKFAPFGEGGPNGAKLRQIIHLFDKHRGNATHVMTAASILSPQHSMTAALAARYELPSLHIIGATTVEKAARYPNIKMALGLGAQFEAIPVAYNPALQAHLAKKRRPDTFVVEYGISAPGGDSPKVEDLEAFHMVGARQVGNLPEEIKTLIVPAGSCNSLTSVLYGLSFDSKNVTKVVSIGIGPNKVEWTKKRLEMLGVTRFDFEWNTKVSLHDSGFAAYGDRMEEKYEGIRFHPTYEGKIIRWMKKNEALVPDSGLGFWIVAGEADEAVMQPYYTAESHVFAG